MKQKLHKVVFQDGNYIIMMHDNGWTLLHYLYGNLGIKGIKIYPLSFWKSIKYM